MAEETLAVFEETAAEYEARVERSEREICRQRRLIDAEPKSGVRLSTAGNQQLLVTREEFSIIQQPWRFRVDPMVPWRPRIKEEAEDMYINQEEADVIAVERFDGKERLKCHRQSQPASRQDCGRIEPTRGIEDCVMETTEPFNLKTANTKRVSSDMRDDQQLFVIKEEFPPVQLRWRPIVEQEEPECLHIKEEEEEYVIKHGKDDIIAVIVKNEEEEEEEEEEEPEFLAPEIERSSDTDNSEDYGEETSDASNLQTVKPFCCLLCGKTFTQKRTLRTHEKIHTGEKPYSCPECGKSFNQKSNLRTHEKIHTEEKPFSCLECGKKFSQKSNLRTHVKIHTGEKPFSCSECGKRFSQKVTLRTHEKIHTVEKPFSCPVCAKTFREKGDLRKHVRIHTGEKPFTCSECGKKFAQKVNLKSHAKIHASKNTFECEANIEG